MSYMNDVNNYDKVCSDEALRVLRNFLPYSTGAIENKHTHNYKNGFKDPLTGYDTDQYQTAKFIYFSDSHSDFFLADESLDNVKRTIEFANNFPVKLDAVIHAGDVLTPFYIVDKSEAFSRANRFFDEAKKCEAPFIFAKGNHDLNDWDNLPENMFTDEDFGKLIYNHVEEKHRIKRQLKKNGSKSTWHYYDIEDKRIRVVSVDINDTDKTVLTEKGTIKYHGGNSFYISQEQMDWIINEALQFDNKEDKNWGVIFTMHHIPKESKFHENAVEWLLDVCAAFNKSSTFILDHKHPENSFFDLEIKADFTRYASLPQKPHIICWLLGHMHEDIFEVHKGINVLYILNNSATVISSDPRVARIPGTVTQNCFDVLSIDTLHRKIRAFRYGAGVTSFGEGGDRFLPDGLSY